MNKIKTNFEGQNIYVGMDVHKASWNLGIHLNDMFIRNVHQKHNPHIIAGYFLFSSLGHPNLEIK
jgi:transposase